jgi:hypothetical protein
MTDDRLFSEQYTAGQVDTETPSDQPQEPSIEEQIDREMPRYGTGKPERIVIKAQITHD